MERVRRQIDAQLHQAVDGAVKVLTERISNAAIENVIQQVDDRTVPPEEEPPGTRSSKRRRKSDKQKT
jgi:hypothetical protein